MNPSFIAGEGTSLDPSILAPPPGGSDTDPTTAVYPLVADSFGTSYSFAAMQLMGVMSQTYSTTNQDKSANLIPSGALVPRHFRNFEGEMYLQDKWNVTPNLTVTAGVRYSLLQPPYEANGERGLTHGQHAPVVHRIAGKACSAGNVVQPDLTFDLSGQANGKKPYWAWNYKNFAPRFAIAYSPHAAQRILAHAVRQMPEKVPFVQVTDCISTTSAKVS